MPARLRLVSFLGACVAAILACSTYGAAPDAGAGAADAASDTTSSCDAGFCDDFDDDAPLGARWTKVVVNGGATLELETADTKTPPRAVRASSDAGVASAYAGAFLQKNLGRGTSLACELDLRVVAGPRTDKIEILHVTTAGPPVRAEEIWFSLDVRTGSLAGALREDQGYADGGCGCPVAATRLYFAPPPDRWVHVTFTTDFHVVTLLYDGTTVASGPMGGLLPNTDIVVDLGAMFEDGHGEILFDDVACSVR
jgi:hypothetical protein